LANRNVLALFQFTGVLSGRMFPPPIVLHLLCVVSMEKQREPGRIVRQWIKSAVITDDTQNCACPARFDTWWGL